jgi:hypothetical protein
VAEPFVSIGHGLKSANDFATNLLSHPVDTATQIAANPGASFRESMRGVNSNIPFANRAVEAIGGPPAVSAEDAAAAPQGLSEFSGVAAAPGIGKMVGGIAAKGIESGAKLVSAADQKIGQKALDIATDPGRVLGAGEKATKVGKYVGKAVGGAVGGKVGSLPGLAIGQHYGGKAGIRAANAIGSVADRVVDTLADRYLARTAGVPAAAEAATPMVTLPARVRPTDPIDAGMAAARKLGPNEFDAFDEPGAANQMVNHATVGGKTGVLPDKSFVESTVGRLKNGTKLADAVKAAEEEPDLRAAVIRDAKKFRAEASPDVEEQPEVDLAAQMQRSIDILEKLKAAKAAGNLTDEMVNAAVDAGVTPALIKKVTGKR